MTETTSITIGLELSGVREDISAHEQVITREGINTPLFTVAAGYLVGRFARDPSRKLSLGLGLVFAGAALRSSEQRGQKLAECSYLGVLEESLVEEYIEEKRAELERAHS